MPKFKDYDTYLVESLKDPNEGGQVADTKQEDDEIAKGHDGEYTKW